MIPLSDMERPGQRFALFNTLFVVLCIAVFAYQFYLGQVPLVGAGADPCLRRLAAATRDALSAGDQFLCTYAVIPSEIVQGQDLFTLVTAMFLHGSLLHLASNMIFLWVFGDNIERAIGRFLYPAFYLLAGIVAFFVEAFVSGASSIPTLGASGAVAGVLGAYLALHPGRSVRTLVFLGFFITVIRVPAVILIGLWAAIQIVNGVLLLGRMTNGGVAYWAHIGGLAFGLVVGLALRALGAARST